MFISSGILFESSETSISCYERELRMLERDMAEEMRACNSAVQHDADVPQRKTARADDYTRSMRKFLNTNDPYFRWNPLAPK